LVTKKKAKAPKSPKSHRIYDKMDKKVEKTIQEAAENNKPIDPKKIRAVMGVSFADYAEVKILGGDGIHDAWIQKSMGENIPKNYLPHMTTKPINVEGQNKVGLKITPFTAKDQKEMGKFDYDKTPDIFTGAIKPGQKKIIWPKYYQNPYQFQDYVYLQDIYANTICGRIFDVIGFFALANGVKPKLRIKNESQYKDDKAKQVVLDKYQWMIDAIEEIERNISTSSTPKSFGDDLVDDSEYPVGPISTAKDNNTPTYDTPLQRKWFSAFINMNMFGRDIIVPRVDPKDNTVKCIVDGKEVKYNDIPKIMLVIHPRDMGFNYIDYMSHRLLGIQLNNSNWILRPDEMIFWENKPDNPVYGSKFYGMSEAQSMMGSARTLRRIIEVDFPLIAKTRWSGMYWLVFKRKG
jgi:hypothetical protein